MPTFRVTAPLEVYPGNPKYNIILPVGEYKIASMQFGGTFFNIKQADDHEVSIYHPQRNLKKFWIEIGGVTIMICGEMVFSPCEEECYHMLSDMVDDDAAVKEFLFGVGWLTKKDDPTPMQT